MHVLVIQSLNCVGKFLFWELFIFPTSNPHGIDLAYWPTGQIVLLIQSFNILVESFLSFDPLALKPET